MFFVDLNLLNRIKSVRIIIILFIKVFIIELFINSILFIFLIIKVIIYVSINWYVNDVNIILLLYFFFIVVSVVIYGVYKVVNIKNVYVVILLNIVGKIIVRLLYSIFKEFIMIFFVLRLFKIVIEVF